MMGRQDFKKTALSIAYDTSLPVRFWRSGAGPADARHALAIGVENAAPYVRRKAE